MSVDVLAQAVAELAPMRAEGNLLLRQVRLGGEFACYDELIALEQG
jgi:hypothetical protein